MSETNYASVADGWHDSVNPRYVEVREDHFNENSLIVSISFDMGEGNESPVAKIPLVYASGHVIVEWKDGNRTEHVATMADQRAAYAFLAALFPAWKDYCKEAHTNEEKIYWFENYGRDAVLSTKMDIKVWHSQSGFPNATVKDPANSRPKRERVTKAAAIQRFGDTIGQVFGGTDTSASEEASNANSVGDNDIQF